MGIYNDWTAPSFYQFWLGTATALQQSGHSQDPFLDKVPPWGVGQAAGRAWPPLEPP